MQPRISIHVFWDVFLKFTLNSGKIFHSSVQEFDFWLFPISYFFIVFMINNIWGEYKNDLGSTMIIKQINGNQFDGIYQTAVGTPKYEDQFPLFGTFVDGKD